jgi:hypothetical protein
MKISELNLAHAPLVDCVEQKRLKPRSGLSMEKMGAVPQRKGTLRHSFPFPLSPRSPVCVPCRTGRIQSSVFACGVQQRNVWRQLQLARAGLAAGKCAAHSRIAQSLPVYGDDFRVKCPTGSGNHMTLFEVAKEIARRLSSIFLRDAHGGHPVYRGSKEFQGDPNWRDYILFYEYFHGDNGAGLGASHQTGWTGCASNLQG